MKLEQLEKLKAEHPPGTLFLFRIGDFYEAFYDDAKFVAKAIGLTLTSREKGSNATPMTGFPYHQLEGYLKKLVSLGKRVAVCEQVKDPAGVTIHGTETGRASSQESNVLEIPKGVELNEHVQNYLFDIPENERPFAVALWGSLTGKLPSIPEFSTPDAERREQIWCTLTRFKAGATYETLAERRIKSEKHVS